MRIGQAVLVLFLSVEFGAFDEYGPSTLGPFATALAGIFYLLLLPTATLLSVRVPALAFVYVAWLVYSVSWNTNFQMWQYLLRRELLPLPFVLVVAATLPMIAIHRAVLTAVYTSLVWTVVALMAFYDRTSKIIAVDDSLLVGWHGDFMHKNIMGAFLVLAMVAILTLERRVGARWIGMTTVVVLVIGSRSATAVSGLIVVAAMYAWSRRLGVFGSSNSRERARFVSVTVFLGLAAMTLSLVLLPIIVNALGRDLTLSGRTSVWREGLALFRERPLQGYGPGGVWFDLNSELAQRLEREIGFVVAHAHNGLLELALQLGAIGVVIVLALIAATFIQAWRGVAVDPMTSTWVLLTVCATMFNSITENTLTGHWITLILVLHVSLLRIGGPSIDNRSQAASELVEVGSGGSIRHDTMALRRSRPIGDR